MTRFLITPSLYNSWHWYRSADDTEAARAELLTTLRREQIPPTDQMLAGREFEDHVQKIAEGKTDVELRELEPPAYQDCVDEVAEIVKGGLWQERIYHDIRYREHGDFLLYGKIDVMKGPWSYDIKFVKRYDIGKYYHNIQHTAYMAGGGSKRFAYLISNGYQVWREDYFWLDDAYQQMRANLADMLGDFGRDRELGALYQAHWGAR